MLLRKPVISEKSLAATKDGWFTFLVDRRFNKTALKSTIEAQFGVNVISIKTANFKSKEKLQRSRKGYFRQSSYKKAIVLLKKGQKIDLFESVSEAEDEVTVTTAEGEPASTALGQGGPATEVKEKKSLLKGTKVKIERTARGQDDLKQSHKESKKRGAK